MNANAGIGLLETLKMKFGIGQYGKNKNDGLSDIRDPYGNINNTDIDKSRINGIATDMGADVEAESSSNITAYIPGTHDTIVDREDFELMQNSRETQNVYCNICKMEVDTKVTEEYSFF